jgi:hypothetical protein
MFGASGISMDIFVFAVTLVYANLLEYALHRWLMHRLPGCVKRDHMLHHSIFRGDHRYHVLRSEDRQFILFEWWQGPLIVGSHLPAFWTIGVLTGWPMWWPGLLAMGAYYAAYEYLHWCMHNPCNRSVERTALFRYLDRNHQIHHTQSRINFNVVFPLSDLVFGTLQQAIRAPRGDRSITPPFEVHSSRIQGGARE